MTADKNLMKTKANILKWSFITVALQGPKFQSIRSQYVYYILYNSRLGTESAEVLE